MELQSMCLCLCLVFFPRQVSVYICIHGKGDSGRSREGSVPYFQSMCLSSSF